MSSHDVMDEHQKLIKLYEISEKEFIKSLNPFPPGFVPENHWKILKPATVIQSSSETTTVSSGETFTTNIGVIDGTRIIDLSSTSKDILYGVLMGVTNDITFSNPDKITNFDLQLTIGSIITSLTVGSISVYISDLSVGNKIYLEVSIVNSGTSWDVIKKKLVDLPPSIPRSLTVILAKYGNSFAQDKLITTWLPSLEGEYVKYAAEISMHSDFSDILETIPDIDGLSCSFLNLSPATRYHIRVKGVNKHGESAWSKFSIRTLNPIPDIPTVDFKVPDPSHHQIKLSWNELVDDYYSFRYTLIRDYFDNQRKSREYTLFQDRTYAESQNLKTDTLNLNSGDDYTYRLIIQFLDASNDIVATVTYTKNVTVPEISAPTQDPVTGEIFAVTSGGEGFVVSIQLQKHIDQALYQYSTKPDTYISGNFTYRPANKTLTRSVLSPDNTIVTLTETHYGIPGEKYYVKYRLKAFPNNLSPFSEVQSITITTVAKPEIGRLRTSDESSTRIKITISSKNASANNTQTLTLRRSVNGIDYTDIHTQLVSNTNPIIYRDDTVQYPQKYSYQAILFSTGGASYYIKC